MFIIRLFFLLDLGIVDAMLKEKVSHPGTRPFL